MQRGKWLVLLGVVVSIFLCATKRVQADTLDTQSVRLVASLGQPVLLADQTQTTFLKVGLQGVRASSAIARAPINVAIVLDRSGSMTGEKIEKAREAAIELVRRLSDDDIVSVVAYGSDVRVVVPATRVAGSDDGRGMFLFRERVIERIAAIDAQGSTALFAGVARGAYELRRNLQRDRVNRVVLLSDGQANVGPSTPGDLAELGAALCKEGISVTTIGLGEGYNEDLMVALARASDGNHAFAATAYDLARIFDLEMRDLTQVVARELIVRVRFSSGVQPIRVLGRGADIVGSALVGRINELYGGHEKYFLIEVRVPAGVAGSTRPVADIEVRYANPMRRAAESVASNVQASFSTSRADVTSRQNNSVLADGAILVANEANMQAVTLRDQGRVAEAQALLTQNAAMLDQKATEYGDARLRTGADRNRTQSRSVAAPAPRDWNVQRKSMRAYQYGEANQSRY